MVESNSKHDDGDENMFFFCFCVIVPYSGEALRKMIDKQHEEIKQKLHKFAEIMKQEHVRVTYFILSTLNQVH